MITVPSIIQSEILKKTYFKKGKKEKQIYYMLESMCLGAWRGLSEVTKPYHFHLELPK